MHASLALSLDVPPTLLPSIPLANAICACMVAAKDVWCPIVCDVWL
jgi:hypothetical protein